MQRGDGLGMSWIDNELIIRRTTGPEVTEDYHIPQETVQEFSASGEEWLDLIADILIMLEGKPTADRQKLVLGHVNADADMIGAVVAQKIRERRERMGR
jgi:hypothetical protein